MKNSKTLNYFIIKEITNCFLKKHQIIEENEIINHILVELKNNNVTENVDKIHLDFNVVYCIFDILDTLGFISRKIEMNLRCLKWQGFQGFRDKFKHVMCEGEVSTIVQDKTFLNYLWEFENLFFKVLSKNKTLTKSELEAIKTTTLFKDCNSKELENRKKIASMFMKLCKFIGFIAKEKKTIETEETIYKWVFQYQDFLEFKVSTIPEVNLFEQISKSVKIEMKKQPTKALITNFENMTAFALLKGKDWQYPMKNTIAIIGRGNTKKNDPNGLHKKWYIDIDLNNTRKISKQHAAVLYNFRKETFEIKCLSKKHPLYVNGSTIISHKDPPLALFSRDMITIGRESFFFLLPI